MSTGIPIGLNGDKAGGAVTATTTRMMVEGRPVLRLGDPVAAHDEHSGATMATATSGLFVEGVAVCRHGDAASCGHTLAATTKKCLSVTGAT